MLGVDIEILQTEIYLSQLNSIINYISYELQNPIASYQFYNNLVKKLSILSYLPQAMPVYRTTKYHYLIMKHWLIFYKIQSNTVIISYIFSSKQDFNNKFLSD
ncbi:MAG: type II toxin-antitoxin system RelE/ParE family toxin [Clostridia bacterium]|nr:type II toxin-antitoxin system RelE/ParE family toxin [Clostridia bacterium]